MPQDALLGIVTRWSGTGTLVAPVDRRTLRPGVPFADLGEYHDAWSLSPHRRLAAFGISAPGEHRRIGIRVLDLGTFTVVRDIETGIAAEAVGWVAPDRLVAFLQSGELVVVDPRGDQEPARQALGLASCTPPNAVTPLGFVSIPAAAAAASPRSTAPAATASPASAASASATSRSRGRARTARRRSDRAALNAALHAGPRRSRYSRTDATFPSWRSSGPRDPLSWKHPHFITQPV